MAAEAGADAEMIEDSLARLWVAFAFTAGQPGAQVLSLGQVFGWIAVDCPLDEILAEIVKVRSQRGQLLLLLGREIEAAERSQGFIGDLRSLVLGQFQQERPVLLVTRRQSQDRFATLDGGER